MDLRLWLWVIVTYCFLLRLAVTRRLRNTNSRRGLLAEVQSEMIPYTDDQAILKCITSPSATIEWLFDGESITTTTSAGDTENNQNNNNQQFTVERNKLIVHLKNSFKSPGHPHVNSLPETWSQNPFKSKLFQCKATLNGETIISEPAKLIITFLDPFKSQLDQQINIVQGNTAVIPCNPPNSVPTAFMEYYFNQTLITRSDDRYLLTNSGNLQILASQLSDSGVYRCVAFNAFLRERQNASWTIRLNVRPVQRDWPDSSQDTHPIYSPNPDSAKNIVHFAVKPANETKAVMGSNVTLECVAQGIKSSPKIVWVKKRNGGGGGGERFLTNRKKYRQLAGNLLLTSIDENDSGVYVCRATVDDVSIETSASLDVQSTPRFNKSLQDTTVGEGNNFTLECLATGNPKPTINWFFNGKRLNSDRENSFSSKLGLVRLPGISFEEDYSKLTITGARSSTHSGIYQCFVSNELLNNDYKSTYSLAHVKILRPGERSETIHFSDSERTIRTDSSPDNIDEMTLLASSVKPNEGRGTGFGRKKRPGRLMVPPTKPKVSRLSDDSVMVYWELSNKPSLPIEFFKLQYKEVAPRSTWNTLSDEIKPWITTQTVSGLIPDAKYRFRVMAVFNNSDYKESPVSDKFHLIRTSMLKKPKEAPNIVDAVPQSPTSIEIVWDNYKESNIEGFIIHYRATSSAGDYFQITVPGSSKSSHIVSQLSSGSSYEFKLQVFNSAGVSDYSKILTATTFDDPVSTTTEVINVIKGLDKNLGSSIENNMDIVLFVVGGIAAFALSVFIVCCIVQCAGRYKQKTQRKKDGPSISQRTNGDLNNGSLLLNHHQTTQSSDEYKSETDTLSSHPDKSSINKMTASVSIDHFPAYHEEMKNKRNNYQTRTYMIDTYCEETPYGLGGGVAGRTGSWSRKSRKKCFETDAGVKLVATASSHNSLQRKYLYENDNHVSSTLEKRRSTFKSEEHLKCSLNARIHSKSSSFTRLDGTLERKKRQANGTATTMSPQQQQPPPVPERSSHLSNHRSLSSSRLNGSLEKRKKSRPDYVNTSNSNTNKSAGTKSNESKMNSYNGTINHMTSKPPLLIMQSTC